MSDISVGDIVKLNPDDGWDARWRKEADKLVRVVLTIPGSRLVKVEHLDGSIFPNLETSARLHTRNMIKLCDI